MGWAITHRNEDTEELRDLVKKGHLFAVQEWIAARKPLYVEGSRNRQPLEIAINKGFHSMVSVLADVWPDEASLVEAARQACLDRRADIVWLLIEKGLPPSAVDVQHIADCLDKELMRFFLDRWDEVADEDDLAYLVIGMARPLTGLIREYAPRLPNSQRQLASALKYFVAEKYPRWIGLSMRMGADPRLPAPSIGSSYDEPEDEWTSAMQDVVWRDNLQALEQFKPTAEKDDLDELLSCLTCLNSPTAGIAEYLVDRGAKINDKQNGGCSILEKILASALHRTFFYTGSGFVDIPRESGHPFRLITLTDSERIRPPIPIDSGH